MKFSILQLSDVHYSNSRHLEISSFIQDSIALFKKDQHNYNAVVFSGDLVHGSPTESSLNKAFGAVLEPFLSLGGLGEKELIICPGNHDCDRSLVSEAIIERIDGLSNMEMLEKFMGGRDFQISLEPFREFNAFIQSKNSGVSDFGFTDLGHYKKLRINGKLIGLVSINNSWRSVTNDAEGKLLFPESQLSELCKKVSDCDFKILVQHHPISEMKMFSRYSIEDKIYSVFDLILNGHYHKAKGSLLIGGNVGAIELAAPAAGTEDKTADLGMNIIDFDFNESTFRIKKFLYNSRHRTFSCDLSSDLEIPMEGEKLLHARISKKVTGKYRTESVSAKTLFVAAGNKEQESDFFSLFTEPVLSREREGALMDNSRIATPLSIESMMHDGSFIVFGEDKCGKTLLLKNIQLRFLAEFRERNIYPIYINAEDFNARSNVLDLIRSYYDLNKNTAQETLLTKEIIILIDNYHHITDDLQSEIRQTIENNDLVRVILTSYPEPSLMVDPIPFRQEELGKIYFHSLRKKQIKELTRLQCTNQVEKQDEIVEKITLILNRMAIPSNFWNVSLFLWIFKRDINASIQSDVELINLYIEKTLEKESLILQKSTFGFDKYVTYLSSLAYELYKNYRRYKYSIDYFSLGEWTKKHILSNPRNIIDARQLIEYVEERGVLKRLDDERYSFRLNGVFEYFLAVHMTVDNEFLADVLKDPILYNGFENELEIYAGLNKGNNAFLAEIFRITQGIYPKSKVDEFLAEGIDKKLDSFSSNLVEVQKLVQDLSMRENVELDENERDTIEKELRDTNGISTQSGEVVLKNRTLDADTLSTHRRYISILGRCFKNMDEISDKTLVYNIFEYVVGCTCLWGLDFANELKETSLMGSLRDKNEDLAKSLLRMVSGFMPIIVQQLICDMFASRNMVRIVEDFNENTHTNEGYLKFIYSFLLLDINLDNIKNVEEDILKIRNNTIRNSMLMKLHYYKNFKISQDNPRKADLNMLIQKLNRLINDKVDLGGVQKSLEADAKRRPYRN